MRTVTENELQNFVHSLRSGSASGYDLLSADFLKSHIQVLGKPLLHIINTSVSTGQFPEAFKVAKVIPIYKGTGEMSLKSNFRPISLLSTCSKVLEKIVKHQLTIYINQYNLLTDCQYGFRDTRNISDALFDLNKKLNSALSRGLKCLIAFCDLAKAFDSVKRSKLLKKLKLMGIVGSALKWFKSYFQNREQFTTINGINSNREKIDYGVLQGSTLGPLLFLIYINNVAKINISGELFLFADDAAIFFEGKNWDQVFKVATRELSLVKKWFDQNLLTLNTSKTKFMPIALRDTSDTQINSIKLHSCDDYESEVCGCGVIDRVNAYKYLGVIIDNRLTWSSHVQYVNGRLRKLIYAFIQLRSILTLSEIRSVYYAYVQSILQHGIIAYGGAYKSIINPLFVTQRSILKVALKKGRRYSSEALYSDFCVFDVRQLYVRNLLIYIFKNSNSIFEPVHQNHFTR